MLTRALYATLSSLLLTGLIISGCAKKPATPASTSAPAPAVAPAPAPRATPPAAAAPSTAAPAPAAPAPLAGPAAARPSPKEFATVDALKDVHFEFDKYD